MQSYDTSEIQGSEEGTNSPPEDKCEALVIDENTTSLPKDSAVQISECKLTATDGLSQTPYTFMSKQCQTAPFQKSNRMFSTLL